MSNELMVLCLTAASIGFLHTILGPDHYLPFTVMSRARKWSMKKTVFITILCGIGHIMSSVVLGFLGVVFGISIMKLEALEAFRGNLAAWAFIGFGFTYFIWGVHKALKNKPHKHVHIHDGVFPHSHDHSHNQEHAHVHDQGEKKSLTPWILFTIFILGPCEPLIPILMYPAAKNSISGLLLVTGIFGSVTIITMLGVVVISSYGVSFARFGKLEKYTHALAGGTICLSGMAIQFLGL
ncbi:MAG: sulfite exporter TauE/SafE family protein [Candidatus Aureabacteria bacterium]|nr:sulfite exporter TauE/SafE family protein [Candidatus Auribacterota bacterium]